MLDGMFVIDSVVHPFNQSDANIDTQVGELAREVSWAFHTAWNPPGLQMSHASFKSDWSAEQLTNMMFRESCVDIAVHHHLPLYSWFKDGWVARRKNVEIAERWPDRYLLYAGVDPTQGTEACLRSLNEQVKECPERFVGLKLYPAQMNPYRYYRLDDLELMAPIYERCLELSITTVATHKAVPMGRTPTWPYRVDDVEVAAMAIPEINFEIVHSGLAFVDECALAAANFPNVYLNLETTFMLLSHSPGFFEEAIAFFALWSGYEKMLFCSGAMQHHPQPLLELFREFQYSDATMEKFGLAQITKADKAKILGLNHARLLNVDVEAALERIKDDDLSRHQSAHGLDAPLSNWRAAEVAT